MKDGILHRMFLILVKGLFKLIYRFEIHGTENIPKEGGFILCSNHIHNWDGPAIYVFAPRRMYIMAKASIFKNPFGKFFMELGGIPVNRDSKDIGALKKSLDVVKKGGILMMFPEGTRRGLEKTGTIKDGAAFLLAATGVPMLPVKVEGEYKIFKKVKITYGKPVEFGKYPRIESNPELLTEYNNKIIENIKI